MQFYHRAHKKYEKRMRIAFVRSVVTFIFFGYSGLSEQ